ncbi:MAG: quinone oxidoreductase [Sinobacteraceae bacterium]|nr:quinone oxidoreductase [Nevskiaceae bacterium]MCP5359495.1 quinone oxidoreductase [Nevskiaceae bacterium]MCP5466838.1 quinone oxidoreductase [Nevskiaceae bacterium]MCP5470927.1 quinone oxidoreductase [Nevskiaceae bacterium]
MATTQAIQITRNGGPEVMQYRDVEIGAPGPDEVQVGHTAIGVNYIDVYDRTGLYPMTLPGSLGREAAGVVLATGKKVRGFRKGDRVAYVHTVPGSYCAVRNVPAARLVKLPKAISDEQAAAMMLKGLTAQYLLRRTYRVKRGDWVLVHAAAGGVGLILCQWARALGAKVIGVVGSAAKARLAKRHGCHHVLLSGRDDLAASVKKLTRNVGVAVVYDSIGADTFFPSLDSLAPLGMMVTYGNATGPVPPFSPLELAKRGSLFLTRPSLFAYIAKRSDLDAMARDLFKIVASRKVKIVVGQRYRLADAAKAHVDLEARRTTGSTVLRP